MAAVRPHDWRRILAVRLDNAGDVVMLGPALRAIAAAAPAARITLLASPAGALAAPLLPSVSDTIVARAPWQDLSGESADDPVRIAGLVAELAARSFDAAFVFTSFSQSPWPPAFAAFLAGIPVRVGQATDFGGALLTHVVPPHPGAVHQAERNARVVEGVGIPVHDRRLRIRIRPGDHAAARAALGRAGFTGGRYLLVAPGASASARRMPVERLVTSVRRIAREHSLTVVVSGSRGERDEADRLAAATGGISIAGATDLPTLAATVAGAALVLTAHSLPVHLADATGRPVVVTFSGTDREEEWAPRHARSVTLRTPTPCAPCRSIDCPWGTPCLDLPTERLVGAARAVLLAAGTRELAAGTRKPAASTTPHTTTEGAWTATPS